MRKPLIHILLFLVFSSCVEPFEFSVDDSQKPLVLEAYISDVSYNESLGYPSDGRFFSVKLMYGQDLSGSGERVNGASVILRASTGESWSYTQSGKEAGIYQLLNPDFKAGSGIEYKLEIRLPTEEIIESDWVTLPPDSGPMGEVSFKETERYEAQLRRPGEPPVIRLVRGINLTVDLPEITSSIPNYYKWKYDPVWIILAYRKDPLHRNYRCWITSNSYLSNYDTFEDLNGGYEKELLFINIDENERFSEKISILVRQFTISEEYYNFLEELKDQYKSGGLFATPPYNLKTNYEEVNTGYPVFGFFSARREQARRIYLTRSMFSAYVSNSYKTGCLNAIPPYSSEDPCDNCLYYNFGGTPSTTKPVWWED